ncbi:uncharacterized peptidase C1-like protein F26E4.3 [Ornithodoros turicata]|uniref:uncharacterized peptidase C1-like protein F26E4.3 n=1 Tax=Ornithodoros turicata TaxID=34597 RepID=UPI003139950D
MTMWSILAALLLATASCALDPDLEGDYCRTRADPCCAGRMDDCSVPILGTLCYCDRFCERPENSDCCPDYLPVCRGLTYPTPPAPVVHKTCLHEGRAYPVGSVVNINCNRCTCREVFPNRQEFECLDRPCLVRPDLVRDINEGDFGWEAANYSFFYGKLLEEGIRYYLGTHQPERDTEKMSELHLVRQQPLPDHFDSRVMWPGLIQNIRDQLECASSWAFSTTAVAADRLAVQSRGRDSVQLSPQDLLSCLDPRQEPCSGGHVDRAWRYLMNFGGVAEDCYQYTSGYNNASTQCFIRNRKHPGNELVCPTGIQGTKYFSTPPYRVPLNEEAIMLEILTNGPVQAVIHVREDLFLYQRGVYRHTRLSSHLPQQFQQSGWHSVRIIGWGVDRERGRPVKYWLCANSWGEKWGERGFFRIARGENESQVESFVVAVWGRSWPYYRQGDRSEGPAGPIN